MRLLTIGLLAFAMLGTPALAKNKAGKGKAAHACECSECEGKHEGKCDHKHGKCKNGKCDMHAKHHKKGKATKEVPAEGDAPAEEAAPAANDGEGV